MSEGPSLDIRLKHGFPGATFALDIAFEAPPGVTALFGPSGSGKTSVVEAIAGLLTVQTGRIAVDGDVLFDTETSVNRPLHKRRIGMVFQDARLFPHRTVRQNLLFGARYAHGAVPDLDGTVDTLGIAHLHDRYPATLSGGEAQRVAIGRAMLCAPRILLLDEPLAALDGARKDELLPYLDRLARETQLPIVYVSHDVAEVARLARTVVLLREGRVVRVAPTAELLADAGTPLGLGARDRGGLIHGVVSRHDANDALTEVRVGSDTVFLPKFEAAAGERVRIRVSAQDVILSRSRPEGLSALNVLSAGIVEIREGGGGASISLAIGEDRLLARVTLRSLRALDLHEGEPCFAIVKASGVEGRDVGLTG